MRETERTSKLKRIATFAVVYFMIGTTAVYVQTTPSPKQQFFQLYVVGNGNQLSDYFTGVAKIATPCRPYNWTLVVTNHMFSAQLVTLVVKLGNSSAPAPNGSDRTPSPVPVLTTFSRVLLNNETWSQPFVWQLVRANQTNSQLSLVVKINGRDYGDTLTSQNGTNVRYIFELWTVGSGTPPKMSFGWLSSGSPQGAWLQLWFDLAYIALHKSPLDSQYFFHRTC